VRVRDAYRAGQGSILCLIRWTATPVRVYNVGLFSVSAPGQSISGWMKGERSITQTSRKEGKGDKLEG